MNYNNLNPMYLFKHFQSKKWNGNPKLEASTSMSDFEHIYPPPEPAADEMTPGERRAKIFQIFSLLYGDMMQEFGLIDQYDDSERFLLDNPHLLCEETPSYLTFWCIDLSIDEKFTLLRNVAQQAMQIHFILELAKETNRETDIGLEVCTTEFFFRIADMDEEAYRKSYFDAVTVYMERVRQRAVQRLMEVMEKERLDRLGPGGLDPAEVMESLPTDMRKCFETQDTSMLHRVIAAMPKPEANHHMTRCIQSGLWTLSRLSDIEVSYRRVNNRIYRTVERRPMQVYNLNEHINTAESDSSSSATSEASYDLLDASSIATSVNSRGDAKPTPQGQDDDEDQEAHDNQVGYEGNNAIGDDYPDLEYPDRFEGQA